MIPLLAREIRYSVPFMTSSEEQQLQNVRSLVQQAVASEPPPWDVTPGSEFAQDDALTEGLPVSAAANTALQVAHDHWQVLHTSLRGEYDAEVVLYLHGQYSLLRGAIENAARAVWLVGSEDRKVRITRRLAAKNYELNLRRRVMAKQEQADMSYYDHRLTNLQHLAAQAEVSLNTESSQYSQIVEKAGELIPGMGGSTASAVWGACSSLAHGDDASINMFEIEVQPPSGASTQVAQVNPSLSNLVFFVQVTHMMYEVGLQFYQQRTTV